MQKYFFFGGGVGGREGKYDMLKYSLSQGKTVLKKKKKKSSE